MAEYTTAELMACVMARALADGEVAVMGAVSQIPMLACRLAQETHAPNLEFIVGGSGAVSPLGPLVPSSCDFRQLEARAALPLPDVILLEGRGDRLDVFFAGGLQIDRYGNCNLVCVGEWAAPRLRGPGTVGLPFLPRAGRTIIYTTAHTPRTFVEKVDFNSGPGFLDGPASWAAAGVPGKGPALVVTSLGVMDFHPESKLMRLRSLLPGVTLEQVQQNTGFVLLLPEELPGSEAGVPVTPEPAAEELAILRQLDPEGIARHLV